MTITLWPRQGERDMTDATKGNCFCGAIEIEASGAPVEMGYCHCNSCRSYSGSPVNAYLLWKAEDVMRHEGTGIRRPL
jgi:hypothetical protein